MDCWISYVRSSECTDRLIFNIYSLKMIIQFHETKTKEREPQPEKKQQREMKKRLINLAALG